MYLKSIDIHGFKSFANKTTITFLQPTQTKQASTAIVGPNGSGKSNVADAIRWVLGEQRMKHLRGKKSEDIIFAGSDAKGKMSMASVSLTIDNSDHKLPIEYDELVITRKLYRTGESEYLVNGHTVRLLDLQLLLAKAQFGQGSYSVIGQGMIDRMLLQNPVERKTFFDEAFGIKEFQIKRHQAQLKLHRTDEHITQAETLLGEVAPRLKSLERQMKKLEERQGLEIDLREAQESYYISVWEAYKGKLDEASGELTTLTSQEKELQSQLRIIQTELATLAREASQAEQYNALQAKHQEVQRKTNKIQSDIAALSGRMQVEYGKAGKQNLAWLEQKLVTLRAEEHTVRTELETFDVEIKNIQMSAKHADRKVSDLMLERTEARNTLSRLTSEMHQQKSEQTFFHLTGLRAVQAVLEEQHHFGQVYGAVAQLADVPQEYQLALDVAAGGHLSSLVVFDESVASKAITYLRANQLGYATFLPVNKIRGRAMPHNIDEILNHPGAIGLAIELATFDGRFQDIFSYVFGATIVVEDLRTAREIGIGRARMVTREGDILEMSGSMKGGYRKRKQSGLSFSERSPHMVGGDADAKAIEVAALEQRLLDLDGQLDAAQRDARDAHSKVEIHVQKRALYDTKQADLHKERSALEGEKSLGRMSESEYSAAMKNIEKEKQALITMQSALEKELETIEAQMTELGKKEEEKKKRVFALQDEMTNMQQELHLLGSKQNDVRVAIAKVETKQEDLENEAYAELHTSVAAIIKRDIPRVSMDALEGLGVQIQKIKYKLSLIGGIDEGVMEEYEETKQRHSGLTMQLDDLKKASKDLSRLVDELDELMKKRRTKAFKDIRKEFKRYFETLFEGGKADLKEIYDEDPSTDAQDIEFDEDEKKSKKRNKALVGIDITACPPGKKLDNLQALSGGERTLTSIALICAILHTNPPPFVVLDEVEAALDEANTLRFTKILRELAERSQFILITHNRATMHAVDALYGVTMGADGISHLLSVKLDQADELAGETSQQR